MQVIVINNIIIVLVIVIIIINYFFIIVIIVDTVVSIISVVIVFSMVIRAALKEVYNFFTCFLTAFAGAVIINSPIVFFVVIGLFVVVLVGAEVVYDVLYIVRLLTPEICTVSIITK